jgi:hypothetical protein
MKAKFSHYVRNELELCSECDTWIEEDEKVFEDEKGYYVCENCVKNN